MITAHTPNRRRIAAELEASRAAARRAAGDRAILAARRPAWRAYLLPFVAVLAAMVLLTWGLAGLARADAPRAVALSAAASPPASLVYLYPAARVTLADARGYTCAARGDSSPAGYFSDISAYQWDGSALSAQVWDARALRYVWRDSAGRAVTWDGVAWRNHTRRPVLVAGWCEPA